MVESRRGSDSLENGAGLICTADILVSDIVIKHIELRVVSVLFLTLFDFFLGRGLARFFIFCGAQLLEAFIFLLDLRIVRFARIVRVIVAHGRHAEYRTGIDIHNYTVCIGALVVDIRLLERLFKIALDIAVDSQLELLSVRRVVKSLILERHRPAVGVLCSDLSAGDTREDAVIIELDTSLAVALRICVSDDMAGEIAVGVVTLDIRVYADHRTAVGILLLAVLRVFVLFLFYLDYFFFVIVFNLLCDDEISVLRHLELFHQRVAVYIERFAQIEAQLGADIIVRHAIGVNIHKPYRRALGENISLGVINSAALSRYLGIVELIFLGFAFVIIRLNHLDAEEVADAG